MVKIRKLIEEEKEHQSNFILTRLQIRQEDSPYQSNDGKYYRPVKAKNFGPVIIHKPSLKKKNQTPFEKK